MHPEILSIALFWFVTAYTPGPNNVVASYSGFNFGITKKNCETRKKFNTSPIRTNMHALLIML